MGGWRRRARLLFRGSRGALEGECGNAAVGRWRRNLPTTGPEGASKGSTGPLVSWLQTIGSVAAAQGLHQGLPAAAIPIHRVPGSNGVSGHSFRESKTTSQQLILFVFKYNDDQNTMMFMNST